MYLIIPGFKKHHLEKLIPKMNELVSTLLEKWSTQKTNIDVDMDLCNLTLVSRFPKTKLTI